MREIGEELGESDQNISYHMTNLKDRGLVESKTAGRSKHVSLTDVGKLYLRWTEG